MIIRASDKKLISFSCQVPKSQKENFRQIQRIFLERIYSEALFNCINIDGIWVSFRAMSVQGPTDQGVSPGPLHSR